MLAHLSKISLLASILLAVAGCKPKLTQQNADKIIYNGMAEADVYKLLGKHGIVSPITNGEKLVLYFFRFTGSPPGVRLGMDFIAVDISNGVVVARSFSDGTRSVK